MRAGALKVLACPEAGHPLALGPGAEADGDKLREGTLGWWRRSRWDAKRLWRPLTRRLPPRLLARIVEWYVPRWLPIDSRLARVPRLGRYLVSIVPCWNYTGLLPLGPDQLREWAILDTFDALAARYDAPQRLPDVRHWFEAAGLIDIDVRYGGNGVLGNARKP